MFIFAFSQVIIGTTPLFSVEELEASLRSHCCVTSGWHNIDVWFAHIFSFRFSFVIVLVFVLTERSAIVLVFIFVFVTKIALAPTWSNFWRDGATGNALLFSRPLVYGRAIGLQCLSRSVVCTECIVAKRCVLEQKLLLTAYRKSYMRNRLVLNEWPWPLFRGRIKVMTTIALHSTLNISEFR